MKNDKAAGLSAGEAETLTGITKNENLLIEYLWMGIIYKPDPDPDPDPQKTGP